MKELDMFCKILIFFWALYLGLGLNLLPVLFALNATMKTKDLPLNHTMSGFEGPYF